jgi:glycosyltransferase involved in cell wall biosynthesis
VRIAFADFCGWDFHVQSVDTQPLGGSHSAACYLARALAAQGHDVSFFTHTTNPGMHAGVRCISIRAFSTEQLRALGLDVFVCLLGAGRGAMLREEIGPKTRLILWTQHSFDQPAMQPLTAPGERAFYDGFALVSDWQRGEFLQRFGLDPVRAKVLRNGVAPAFQDIFAEDEPILPAKASPPLLAYTSTPFRGLDLLLEAFPSIRKAVPGVRLHVYSSMQVYQTSPAEDQAEYGRLYQRCRETAGVEYVGSLPQPALAKQLRSVTALAYPNSFPETSCIAALEALAAGCRIVTSDLGALPETTADFGRLIPVNQSRERYLGQFVAQTISVLRDAPNSEVVLRRQIGWIKQSASWPQLALDWQHWLESLPPR